MFMTVPQDFTSRFLEQLHEYVFFHLGSDAQLDVESEGGGLRLVLRHPRIHAARVQLGQEEMMRLVDDRDRFEVFFLDLLTSHRKT